MTTIDWRQRATTYLIDGGTVGRRESDVIKCVARYTDATGVQAFLTSLVLERRAQKFQLPDGTTQWRATTNILVV